MANTIPTSGTWGAIAALLNGNFIRAGWYNYGDSAVAQSISANTTTKLNNDGLSIITGEQPIGGVTGLWNATTNQFDFSSLEIGDIVIVRPAVFVTTSAQNQNVLLDMQFGIGGTTYELLFEDRDYKSVVTGRQLTSPQIFYIGDANTRDNPAEMRIRSDASMTADVYSFFIAVVRRGL